MKKFLCILMALFMLMGVAACNSTEENNGEENNGEVNGETNGETTGETIKIGLNYELSGGTATYGQSSVDGIELAVKEINEAGGVNGKQVELVKYDNKSDASEAFTLATKLMTSDGVVAVLGPATTGNFKAVIPVAEQNKIPVASGSATGDDVTVEFNEDGEVEYDENGKPTTLKEYAFRICFNDSFQGTAMAKFAANNLNATKALLLGLYAEGVREVLAITGDPIPTAERDEVKNVYQFNSRKLAQYIVSLAGEGREMPSAMTVLGALNLNARNFDVELRRAVEKLENGMSGFLTQPVLSAQAVENLKKARETLGERAKILAGILPVVSQRNAIFMENEVNGIHVDDAIIQRFEGLDRAAGEELGLEVSVQAAKAAAPYADGFYLMTPFNRVALMERLIARLRTEVTG